MIIPDLSFAMSTPAAFQPFAAITLAPRDPILGLNEAFNADPRSDKVNLGVGVYSDENGKIPLLECVKAAEAQRLAAQPPRGYQPIDGPAAYNRAVQALLFGDGSATAARSVTVQALGGTGALRIGADFLLRMVGSKTVHISDPSWENHRALFEMAGFTVCDYPYFDPASNGVRFDALRDSLNQLPSGDVVLLHACCHNPTGADLDAAQWAEIVAICAARGLIPFLDMAYQGFADGIHQDAAAVRLFADSGLPCLVASSFSKSLSLYGERVGALTVLCQNGDEAARVLSQIKRIIRTNYSNPPTHGGAVATAVLNDATLRQQWEAELTTMRDRIRAQRHALVHGLAAAGFDFGFINQQRGMFSYTGLTAGEVEQLRDTHGIYAVSTGRICLAALNARNLPRVIEALVTVLKN